ncbi:MAG TPA: hypothetical protein GX741_04595 [Erysipelothrix sp.]|nr:hypothetical protein [Erysipelothrix sp.]
MNFFDTRTMGQSERFRRVTIIMIPLSVIIGLFFGAINDWMFGWELSVLYILVGALIGYLVLTIGRGAQKRFRYLAVVCAALAIISADVLFPVLFYQTSLIGTIQFALANVLSGPSGLISLLFRGLALGAAYQTSV